METTRGFVRPDRGSEEPEVVADLPEALEADLDGGDPPEFSGSAGTKHALYWWDAQDF